MPLQNTIETFEAHGYPMFQVMRNQAHPRTNDAMLNHNEESDDLSYHKF